MRYAIINRRIKWGPQVTEQDPTTIARYKNGPIPLDRIETALTEAWELLVSDGTQAPALAEALGVSVDALRAMPHPPMRPEPDRSGLGAGEIGIVIAVWVGSEVVLKALAELAKDALKAKLKLAWEKFVLPELTKQLRRRNPLGQEVDQD